MEHYQTMTDKSLPAHTHVASAQANDGAVKVAWRPMWLRAEEVDSSLIQDMLCSLEERLNDIPMPAMDFWWRADTEVAVLDYSQSYHLCLLPACKVCQATSSGMERPSLA